MEPFLMTRAEAVSLKDAARRAGLSVKTIRRLHAKHAIGRQMGPNAPIEVSYPAVVMLQHGDLAALERLRAGDRESPTVQRYLALIGVEDAPVDVHGLGTRDHTCLIGFDPET